MTAPLRLSVWFDYASPYSYLAVSRVEGLVATRAANGQAIEIDWRPFLLGPIFQRRSANPSPFQDVSPSERGYRWRDVARHAALYDIPWTLPTRYPPMGLNAARLTLVALEEGWGRDLIRAAYSAAFAEDRDIADPEVLRQLASSLGRDGEAALRKAQSERVKIQLTQQVETAINGGLFGAPSFVVGASAEGTGGEVFWGNDRLEQALTWAEKPWL
ncbi:2-hydroxychromene-2-carboxylate isomerase [Ferrovibrio sp. MS7]|uniref:2-hydroxychromene-2-carboxylate isomerase n=1 Tax=Ferrovibrio plantarum TaxID=3119164 RepID=UPI003136FF97